MPAPELSIIEANRALVWRVGRAPDPWAWIDHRYAGHQRWDDIGGVFRTIYVADSLYACFVEVLAYSRPDVQPGGMDLLEGIVEDPEDAAEYPVPRAGTIPREWIHGRMVAEATLAGRYVDVRTATSVATLRPHFVKLALTLGFPDFDAAALKSADPRELTQHIAAHLYALTDADGHAIVDGIRFASRHGDNLSMWAIFERSDDGVVSQHLEQGSARLVDLNHPDLARAMDLHQLTWT
ncbi:RES domain-containing protein [Subtercola vilae]|uniref:RES domain-containing protein n=1 Tax=Subtercola vilae TaxID=2056433 RepID=A0A4T2BNX5_9MICO|nr:RES domain-containing protein [Subtercola vilae]